MCNINEQWQMKLSKSKFNEPVILEESVGRVFCAATYHPVTKVARLREPPREVRSLEDSIR